ncbi:Ger(x)C family spore germination protein [Paenibacillus cremeus]|uniref:Ger(X)C family spore germination protein n=1 Tax=Paenibacillus cremeus TaxID=2163881 RepID=A0A559K0B1_9BACL|nr:Ger(x)C family spore germination protein [Paenibacillus cremeus]TVY05592.1 Ger(x)C family spore germination protein [Paenibacillus cremeus]
MKRNNRFKLFIILTALTILCGCWDVKEINLRTPPVLIGIAKGNHDEFKVTLYVPITQRGKTETRIVTEQGNSISNILQQMQTNSDDALDYTQVQFIVIHNNLAENEEEMGKLVRLLMEFEQLPSKALVAFTDEDIEKMMSNIEKVIGVHATSIQDFFYKGGWAPEVSSTRIWELYQSLYSYTKDINIPIVVSGQDTVLRFEGSAILKKEKMVGRINPKENLLVNLFHHRNATGEIESLGSAGMIVKNSSLHIKSSMEKDGPLVSCSLKLKIKVMERKKGVTDKQIQEELEKQIEKQFNKILEQAQKNKSDIFGLGQHFRNQIPYQELKNWREDYYPKLKVNFQVHVSHL